MKGVSNINGRNDFFDLEITNPSNRTKSNAKVAGVVLFTFLTLASLALIACGTCGALGVINTPGWANSLMYVVGQLGLAGSIFGLVQCALGLSTDNLGINHSRSPSD